jgi:hypothetical protein
MKELQILYGEAKPEHGLGCEKGEVNDRLENTPNPPRSQCNRGQGACYQFHNARSRKFAVSLGYATRASLGSRMLGVAFQTL